MEQSRETQFKWKGTYLQDIDTSSKYNVFPIVKLYVSMNPQQKAVSYLTQIRTIVFWSELLRGDEPISPPAQES